MLLRSFFIFSFCFILISCSNSEPTKATEDVSAPKQLVSELDTFYGGKNLLIVKDTTQTAFASLFTLNNDTNETANLKHDAEFVNRIGDSLIFKLTSSTKILVNKGSEADDFENYKYIGKLKDINSYIVFATFWESYAFLVINASSGKETYLCGYPNVSPNKKHLVAVGFDLQAAFVFNGIQMYDVTPDSLSLNWSRELTKWGGNNLAWLDNDNLMVEKMYVDSNMQILRSYIKISSGK